MENQNVNYNVPSFITLATGESIRADMIFAVRPCDTTEGSQATYPPRVVVDFGSKDGMGYYRNSVVLDCGSYDDARVMAGHIIEEVESAMNMYRGKDHEKGKLFRLLALTTEADTHEPTCPELRYSGPCDCLCGKIQEALGRREHADTKPDAAPPADSEV